jgi:predicted MFS family arabinose efflux permease
MHSGRQRSTTSPRRDDHGAAPHAAAHPGRDGGNARWRVLALLFACRIGLGFQFQTLASVSDSLVGQLGLSYAQVGTLIGLFMLPGLVLSLPAGHAGRHVRDRTLVTLGMLLLAGGGIVAALAPGMSGLALARLVCGAGFVFTTIYLTKITADWFSGRELATAMSVLVMSWPIGIAIGQVLHVWLDQQFGWRAVFAAASAYCGIGAAALWFGSRATPPGAAAALRQDREPLLPREWVLTLLAAAVWALLNAAYVVYLSFAPRVLEDAGHPRAEAAALLSVASWLMIVSGPLCGRLVDRGVRRDLVVYAGLAASIMALLMVRAGVPPLLPGLLLGLVGMAPAGIVMALTGQAMAPQRRAYGMGVFYSVYFLLLALAPPLAGALVDRSGDAYTAMIFAAVLAAGAALAYAGFGLVQRRRGTA